MPLGLTAIRLLLAATCVATLWTAYSVARPSGDGGPKAGWEPVRVVEQPAFEAPPIGHAAKLPALAPPPPAEIARSLAPAERHRTTASDGTGRGAPASDGDVAASAACRSARAAARTARAAARQSACAARDPPARLLHPPSRGTRRRRKSRAC